MNEPLVLVGGGVLLVVALGCAFVLLGRTRRELAQTRREADELRSRMDHLAEQLTTPAPEPVAEATEFLITAMGATEDAPDHDLVPQRIEGRLFADIVLRETVVRAASLTHGVRRALAPETRNRIRFEMRRELKRARKQRRADLKAARRDWQARERATLGEDEDAA